MTREKEGPVRVEIGLPPPVFTVRGLRVPRVPWPPGPVAIKIVITPPSRHAYTTDVLAAIWGGPHRPLSSHAQSHLTRLEVAALRDLYGWSRSRVADHVRLPERKITDYHREGAEWWKQIGGRPWAQSG
jgi:hypothetical protein